MAVIKGSQRNVLLVAVLILCTLTTFAQGQSDDYKKFRSAVLKGKKGISYSKALNFFESAGLLAKLQTRIAAKQLTTVFFPNDVLFDFFLTPNRKAYFANAANKKVLSNSAALHFISDKKTVGQLRSAVVDTKFFTLVEDVVPRRINKVTQKGFKPPRFVVVSKDVFGPNTGFLVTDSLFEGKYVTALVIDEVLSYNSVRALG